MTSIFMLRAIYRGGGLPKGNLSVHVHGNKTPCDISFPGTITIINNLYTHTEIDLKIHCIQVFFV